MASVYTRLRTTPRKYRKVTGQLLPVSWRHQAWGRWKRSNRTCSPHAWVCPRKCTVSGGPRIVKRWWPDCQPSASQSWTACEDGKLHNPSLYPAISGSPLILPEACTSRRLGNVSRLLFIVVQLPLNNVHSVHP